MKLGRMRQDPFDILINHTYPVTEVVAKDLNRLESEFDKYNSKMIELTQAVGDIVYGAVTELEGLLEKAKSAAALISGLDDISMNMTTIPRFNIIKYLKGNNHEIRENSRFRFIQKR